MKFKLVRFILIIFLCTTINKVFGEEISINTDEQAQEILLNHNWKCSWEGQGYNGTVESFYEEASLKKVAGKFKSSYCPDGFGKFKGKIKKGKVTTKEFGAPSPCVAGTSKMVKLTKSADGSYTIENKLSNSSGWKGTSTCTSSPK